MRKQVVKAPQERELVDRWRRLPPDTTLRLLDGGQVRVRYPGRRNGGPGPDFLDAILETADGEVRGAVELHRQSSDWARHGHGADPRYTTVVLHVVAHHDGLPARAPGGAPLPTLELLWPADATFPNWPILADEPSVPTETSLIARSGDSSGPSQLSFDAMVTAPPPGQAIMIRFPCQAQAAARGVPRLREALGRAGDARFQTNVERFIAAFAGTAGAGRDQTLYEALAEALGYEPNVVPLRRLAQAVPLAALQASLREGGRGGAEAWLLGMAGLLPSARHLPSARRREATVLALEESWLTRHAAPALRPYDWTYTSLRPENNPVRRVLALVSLAAAWPERGLLEAARHHLCTGDDKPATAARALRALLHVPCPAGYWAAHWDFGVPFGDQANPPANLATKTPESTKTSKTTAPAHAPALVGPSRAADMVVNVLLPALAAAGHLDDDALLEARARQCYAHHPRLSENWITRLMRERINVSDGVPDADSDTTVAAAKPAEGGDPLVPTARHQQGLLAVYVATCHELTCAACVLGGISATSQSD